MERQRRRRRALDFETFLKASRDSQEVPVRRNHRASLIFVVIPCWAACSLCQSSAPSLIVECGGI